MDFIFVTGIIATIITTLSSLPQVIKIWRTRKTRDLSLGTYALLCTGMALWLAYGVLRADSVLIIANVVALGLYSSILFLKIKYG